MPLTIKPVKNEKNVFVFVASSLTECEPASFHKKINAVLADNDLNRILFDVTKVDWYISIAQQYHFICGLHSELPLDIRIALLARPEDFENICFVEALAQNRKMNLRAFFQKDEGLAWLNGDSVFPKKQTFRPRGTVSAKDFWWIVLSDESKLYNALLGIAYNHS